jgi:type IV pilus assembly protein PilY1
VTGDKLWHFSDEYLSSVNDIPGAVTLADTGGDNLMDRVYVGDMDGRLWELDAVDGTNPNGTVEVEGVTKQMPLWNAGVGKPISVSPAIVRDSGHLVLVFGTGGTDWAANGQAYSVYAVDATQKTTSPTYWDSDTEQGGAGSLLWEFTLPVGEKVWSAPSVAAGLIFVATASGTMESANPRKDVTGSSKLYALESDDGSEAWSMDDIGRARGSIYVDSQHVYLTTINNLIRQIGEDTFPTDKANNVILNAWREFW